MARGMQQLRNAVLAFGIFTLAGMGLSWAHAYIVSTEPAMNGSYVAPAGQIGVSFDEPIDILDADALEVTDAHGARVDLHDADIDPQDATRVVVRVPRHLPPGVYTVHWRVISADTHVVHGEYLLGVGVPVSGTAPQEASSPFDPAAPLASLLRLIAFTATILAAGAIFFQVLVLPYLGNEYVAIAIMGRRAAIVASVVLLLVTVANLIVQAAASTGTLTGVGSAIVPTIARSAWGYAFILRMAGAGVTLVIAAVNRPRWAAFAVVPALAILLSFSIAGHALAFPTLAGRLVAEAMDFIHILSVSIWIGGVFILGLALPVARARSVSERFRFWQPVLVRFTPIAVVCVLATIVTGTYAAIVHIPHIADLVNSLYGKLLSLKIISVAVLLFFGYRQMCAGMGKGTAAEANGRYEALVAFIILILTALLVGQMPPMRMPAMPGM